MSKKEAPSGQAPVQLMYIGPTLLHPVLLTHRSVYMGGIPKIVSKQGDKDLAGCFVSLADAGKALRELEGYPGTKPGEFTRSHLSVRKKYLETKAATGEAQ